MWKFAWGFRAKKKYQNAKIQSRPTRRVVIYQAHEGCSIEGRPGQPGFIYRKKQEMRFIFRYGTVAPSGLNQEFSFT